jgi:hypothetical protein
MGAGRDAAIGYVASTAERAVAVASVAVSEIVMRVCKARLKVRRRIGIDLGLTGSGRRHLSAEAQGNQIESAS